MNSATNTLRGDSYSSRGVPTCSIKPRDITIIRSDIATASP